MYETRVSNNQLDKFKIKKTVVKVSIVMGILISSVAYLTYAWSKYQKLAEQEALQVAESIGAMIHTHQIEMLLSEDEATSAAATAIIKESLDQLVETDDSVYYAYLLKKENNEILVQVDSFIQNFVTSKKSFNKIEKKEIITAQPFRDNKSVLIGPISTDTGNWLRALVPIKNENSEEIVLGLSYSFEDWNYSLYQNMISDIIIVLILNILAWTILIICTKSQELLESERSKSVILSHLPGMAYRSKNDLTWTMEWVSDGSYELTGYQPEELIDNKGKSYADLITLKHTSLIQNELQRILDQKKKYKYEYELLTKNNEHKWVMEVGQGLYDKDGNLESLEGVVFDITERKLKEHQIENLTEHDLLTGLFNRSYMEEKLKKMDKRNMLPFSILICDIDGLAVINDAYGYEKGDELIRWIANLIGSCLDEESVFGHLGGGEFMVYLPFTDKQKVESIQNQVTDKVKRYTKNEPEKTKMISVSTAFSTKNMKDQDIHKVLKETETHLRRRKMLNQNSSHSAIVSSIMASLYAKSEETEEHGQRLGEYCMKMGKELNLPQGSLDDLLLLAKIHDVGKIGIDDRILKKPGKLTEEEWRVMKQHSEIGYDIAMSTPQLEHVAEPILYHHERWDGTGYPKGLVGSEIPFSARILALADAYDAMIEDRIYRKALSHENAVEEIRKNAGTQFDPLLADMFIEILENEKA